jgi:hypothetical protein
VWWACCSALSAGRGGEGEWLGAAPSPARWGDGPLWSDDCILPSPSSLAPWRRLVCSGGGVCMRRPESFWELISGVLRRLLFAVMSGLKGVGHRSLCFARRALCCCPCCGGYRRRPRRIWRRCSWTGSRFIRRSRVLSTRLQDQIVFLFLWGPFCNCVTDRCDMEAVSGSFATPLR